MLLEEQKIDIRTSLGMLADECWRIAEAHGWHAPFIDAEKLLLMHTEISEHVEALRRKGEPQLDPHCPEFSNEEIEMADLIIRIMDYAYHKNYRIGSAVIAKMNFNATRPFKHGKAF